MGSRCFRPFTSIKKNPHCAMHFLRKNCVCVCVCVLGGGGGAKGWQSLISTSHLYCFENKRPVCFYNTNIQNTHFSFIFVFLEKNIPALIFLSFWSPFFHIVDHTLWLCGGFANLQVVITNCVLHFGSKPQMIHNFLGYYYSATCHFLKICRFTTVLVHNIMVRHFQ